MSANKEAPRGPHGGRRRGAVSPSEIKEASGSLKRVLKQYFKYFPVLAPIIIVCVLTNAVVASVPSVFIQKVIAVIEQYWEAGDWDAASKEIMPLLLILIGLYALALVLSVLQSQLLAYMTQKFLHNFRRDMFSTMQRLPIRYFDTHKHGYIMSHYTNDIDTLRQLISMALPSMLQAAVTLVTVFYIMNYYSLWLTLVLVAGVVAMALVSGKIGGGSAKYFVRQQQAVAATEGYVQEMMNGQKVIKVFNHEKQGIEEFNKLNDELCSDSAKANAYANILGPIVNNIGNILYVLLATVGGILLLTHAPNISISRMALDISILVPFLNMSKQFMGQINQLTMQVNAVVMAGAGAKRIFALIDEPAEADEGYVTLTKAKKNEAGEYEETTDADGVWAWRHPHQAEGTVTFVPVEGDVVLKEVDFEYVEGKQVLYDISVFAEPGQKVAFVGATGAGKTTITNLINRFYDIADGKIRYDGINVNKIKKKDLRRSLGLVLQETNLFTGTVMDNIRYGRLDASDEECRDAARLAGADDFIERLPEGYNTPLSNNGSNLSQGQRQLIAIARAAVADPPVMILDEATSSIDTRTEKIVQRGMDKLMEGRTVFVIAHRLSTVMDSDVIMVLDHGHIIERGSHEKLINEKGTYYQLYTGAFELE